VFHIIDYPTQFLADPSAMIFTRAGFSIYGGLFFGIAAGALFLKRRAVPIMPMLDATAPSLMLGYAVGRLGCQLSGDGDWGIASDMTLKPHWLPNWLWAQTYDGNVLGVLIPDPGVYPTPVYESGAALVLFGVLWALRSASRRPPHLFSVYLLLAGFERLLIEKIRVNARHDWLGIGLTQAEAISVLVVVAGLLGVLVTLTGRRLWVRILLALSVVAALSACVPFR
jgi:phosphatidylglycerol:prolipoprotein diacylglycerol transferase